MREEVQRIIKLVQEGKISSEDAADLIDAFASAEAQKPPQEEPPTPPDSKEGAQTRYEERFRAFVATMEKFGKEASGSVKWDEIARRVREGTLKGVDVIVSGLDEVAKGRVNFNNLFGIHEIKEVTLPLAVPEGKVLRIENPAGNLRVTGGATAGSVTAKARFRGVTQDDARQKSANYTLIIEESDHNVVIRQPDVSGLSVDVDVQLAGSAILEVRCDSGDVTVINTKAGARLTTKHGDIHVKGLDGLVEINGTAGDIMIEETQATLLTAESKAGNITLRAVSGTVNVRTTSGNVTARECKGKLYTFEAVSGNVSVDLSEPVAGKVDIRTVSGNAQISIVDGSDCRVSLSTLRGTAESDISLADEARTEQRITGRLGSGSGTLDVSAVSGDIYLKLRDQISSEP
jgi:hypothetical protein